MPDSASGARYCQIRKGPYFYAGGVFTPKISTKTFLSRNVLTSVDCRFLRDVWGVFTAFLGITYFLEEAVTQL